MKSLLTQVKDNNAARIASAKLMKEWEEKNGKVETHEIRQGPPPPTRKYNNAKV